MELVYKILLVVLSIVLFIVGTGLFKAVFSKLVTSKIKNNERSKTIQSIFVLFVQIGIFYCISKFILRTNIFNGHLFAKVSIGMIYGLIMMMIPVVLLLLTKTIKIQNITIDKERKLWLMLLFFTLMALIEEVVFRGFILIPFSSDTSIELILIISSTLFLLPHIVNKGRSVLGLLTVFLLGICLGILTIATGDIWIAFGFHLTWNYTQGFFGLNVSGDLEFSGYYKTILKGNKMLSGGAFGVEASIVTVILLIVTNIIMAVILL